MKKLNKNNKEGNNTFNLGGKEMNNNLGGIKMEAKRNRRRNIKGNDNLGGLKMNRKYIDMQWYKVEDITKSRDIMYLVEGYVKEYLESFELELLSTSVQEINPSTSVVLQYKMWHVIGYTKENPEMGIQFLVYIKDDKLVLELVKMVGAKRGYLNIERKVNSTSRLIGAKSIKSFLRNTCDFDDKDDINWFTTAILTVSDLDDVCEDKVVVSSNYGIIKRLYAYQGYCIVRNNWKNSLSYNESFVCSYLNDVPHRGARKVFTVIDLFIKYYNDLFEKDCTLRDIFVENTDMGDYKIQFTIVEKNLKMEIITNKNSDLFYNGDVRFSDIEDDKEEDTEEELFDTEKEAFDKAYKDNEYGQKGALTFIRIDNVDLVFVHNLAINYEIAKGILSSVIKDSQDVDTICIYQSSDGFTVKGVNNKDNKKEYPYRYKKVDGVYVLIKEDWITASREEIRKLLNIDDNESKEVSLNELQGKMEELIKDSESIIGKIDELEKLKNDLQFILESHRNKIFEIQDDIEKIKNKGGK